MVSGQREEKHSGLPRGELSPRRAPGGGLGMGFLMGMGGGACALVGLISVLENH